MLEVHKGGRNVRFPNNTGQTTVCRGVPEAWVGDGVCSEEDSEWAEASLWSSSTLLWSSALRNSSSFRLWCTGTYNRKSPCLGVKICCKKTKKKTKTRPLSVLPGASCAGSSGRSNCSTIPGVWKIPLGTERGAGSPRRRGWWSLRSDCKGEHPEGVKDPVPRQLPCVCVCVCTGYVLR